MKLELREFRMSDLDGIVAIEKNAFEVGPYSRGMLKRLFMAENSFSLVAEEYGELLGYVSAIPIDRETADVESIAVDPKFQGRGVGGALLDGIEQEMVKRGFDRSILEVRDMNYESIRFYRNRGYVEIKHMKSYYNEYYRGSRGAYRMAKRL